MLTKFGVKNYKALESVSIPLTPIHVVIGQNDSGKTSLLEAIHAFCNTTRVSLDQAFPGKWQGRELVYFGAQGTEVEMSASSEGFINNKQYTIDYMIGVDFASEDQELCHLTYERYKLNNETIREVPPTFIQATTVGRRAHVASEIRVDLDIIAKAIGTSSFYSFDPKVMSIPAAIDHSRKFRMDPDGFGLPTMLDDILGHDPEKFLSLQRDFCGYFPEFRKVHLETEMAAHRGYQASGLHNASQANGKGVYFETQDGHVVRAQQASDGAILFLGFLALSYLPTPPKTLLIEEPEKGVYPKRLAQIIDILRRLIASDINKDFPQIIMTTHSPYVLTPFSPEEVTLMSRRNGSVIARPLRDAPNIDERLGDGEFYLGELWYNLDEEELFQDASPQPSA
jgi:predicted ATPase